MSDRTAESSSIAVDRLGSTTAATEALDHERRGRADRVEGRRDRHPGLDRADVVVVEDLDDLGLLDSGHALRLLGVVDEDHAAAHRRDEIRAGQQPDRALAFVDDDRGAMVRVLDLLGDVD